MILNPSVNAKIPVLNEDTAEKILRNVFDTCDVPANTVPLSTLESYSEYKREKFSFQKTILIIIFVVFLTAPFCFILPSFTADMISDENSRFPQFEVVIDGWFPIDKVSATIDGNSIAVYETGDRTFCVEATSSGTLEMKVLYLNGQYNTKTMIITGIDGDAPYLVSSKKTGNYLCLFVADDGLGVNYNSIYAITNSGEKVDPVAHSAKLGEVVFPIVDESMTVYIPDVRQNELQLVVSFE